MRDKEINKNIKSVPLRSMTLEEFAQHAQKNVTELILVLLKKGAAVNKNQVLSVDQIETLAELVEVPVEKILLEKKDIDLQTGVIDRGLRRSPVIVVIGHVDHGKTSLLDYIRKTRIASREKGGITQHLGAYEVETKHGKLTFLDTPGHEAFSMMRLRGTRAADAAILIVAADDGVMPQTVEAIKHAKACELPIVVAINKIDKATDKQIDAVKNQIAQHGLVPEEWGGDVTLVPISAKTGKGIDDLLEVIAIRSEDFDLMADPEAKARGYILESKLEKGRGAVATFISQHGTLKIGDTFLCGETTGKVTALVDCFGNNCQVAEPSKPIRISGFDDMPEVGDALQVVSVSDYQEKRALKKTKKLDMSAIGTSEEGALRVIVKADVQSSREAVVDSLQKLSQKIDVPLSIISSGIGQLTEGDVELAAIAEADIFTFSIKADSKSQQLAKQRNVNIYSFDIIYKLLEFVEELLKKKIVKEEVRIKVGEAIVRKVFNIKNVGVIAGVYIRKGKVVKDLIGVIMRGNQEMFEGKVKSLQKDKKVVKELLMGSEGAFIMDGFADWQEDDIVLCYEIKK
jgi:translation initiation factor IF-2